MAARTEDTVKLSRAGKKKKKRFFADSNEGQQKL